jgi:glycosyltransferase involved in cell wall biosynthesis
MDQSERGFEWIVGDDGSTDDTPTVATDLAARSDFPITVLRASAHVGKSRIDNAMIEQARGELTLWCDSDDWLTPDAVRELRSAWSGAPQDFVGLTALAAEDGKPIFAPAIEDGVSWNAIARLHPSDMLYVVRTEELKRLRFPEVDMLTPESVFWTRVGDRPTRYVNRVLLAKEYRAPNAISFSGRMAYNRGRAHALAICSRAVGIDHLTRWQRYTWQADYLRYCIHGEIGLGESRRLRDELTPLEFWSPAPIAAALAVRDQLRSVVDKTHREFEANLGAAIDVSIRANSTVSTDREPNSR